MKKLSLLIVLFISSISFSLHAQEVQEGFEQSCNENWNSFYLGCIPDWISTSGTPDNASSHSGVTASEGLRYVRIHASYDGWACPSSPQRSEGVAINYNFQKDVGYEVSFDEQWRGVIQGFNYPNTTPGCTMFMTAQWVLSDIRPNQQEGGSCDIGGATPVIDLAQEQVVHTQGLMNDQTTWQERTFTFIPEDNFSQLWLRITIHNWDCPSSAEVLARLYYLDDFKISTCSQGYTTLFNLAAGAINDFSGNVYVQTQANPNTNPDPVVHNWNVHDLFTDDLIDNQCCNSETAFFDDGMVVNRWYYVKHGMWNDCLTYRESRRRFRVQQGNLSIGKRNSSSDISKKSDKVNYIIEIEDMDFNPTEEYLSEMDKLVRVKDINEPLPQLNSFEFNNPSGISEISNFPNPFTSITTIQFSTFIDANVTITISDLHGKTIETLLSDERVGAGSHAIPFNAIGLTSGIYFYTVSLENHSETKRMIVR